MLRRSRCVLIFSLKNKQANRNKRECRVAGEPHISPLILQCSLLLTGYLEWTERRRALVWAKHFGSGTGFWQFNYAGEAREIFSNYVIETGVLRVSGWLVGCVSFCVDVKDDAQQCNILGKIPVTYSRKSESAVTGPVLHY